MQKSFNNGFLFLSSLLAAGVLLFASCGSQEQKPAAEKEKYVLPDTIARSLKIDTVSISQLVNSITLTGKVGSDEDHVVPVNSMVSGIIQDVKVMLGDYVKEGQALALVKSTEIAGYSNDLVNAETNLRLSQTNLQKTKDLYKSGLASMTDSLNAEISVQQAQSELNRVHAVLKINGVGAQGEFVVKAPISGFVVQKSAINNMAMRADNSTSLFTISDLKTVWIQANVYESNISLIKQGENVDVTTLAYPGRIFKGKIDKVMNVLDPASKVMKVRVVLPNPGYVLKPEMYASITVSDKENAKCLSVPSQALIFDHSQYYVLVYNSQTDIKITPVQVLNTVGDRTFIASGVNDGDKVIGSQAILIYNALNS
ncbi:efflux RND transporter periplasmic adaptor subunit [Puia sp.]|jgi:cobalt-zinc-cadmium efflux system membrane fusion protein|uniref:efflux RND transporter periplasmic adaptor subunit n=1 Tax=Puia sp. TaxID=2045100 RepID=UPI002F3E4A24